MPVWAEALCVQHSIGGQPHQLSPEVQRQRLVDPAQRLPQVRHEFQVLVASLLKSHAKGGLHPLGVLVSMLPLLQQAQAGID